MEKPKPAPPFPSGRRLESWKEIAKYLDRDVRTVQRWEESKGLPVRRLPGGEMARVYALESELDAWWDSRGVHLIAEADAQPVRVPNRRYKARWAGFALAGAGLVALALWWLLPGRKLPEPHLVPLTSYVGEVLYPSFSPDSKQVVFTWNGEKQDNHDLYVKLVGEGDPLRLTTDPAWDGMASWSPDGSHIAFLRWPIGSPKAQILVMPALGGGERKLADVLINEIWPMPLFSWTRDGGELIAGWPESPHRTALCRLDVNSGERKRLTTPPVGWWGDDSPVVSPDGTRVAFIRRRGPDQGNLYLLRLTGDHEAAGEPRELTHESCCVANPMWTGNGREILYVNRETDITRLHRIAAQPGAQPQLVRTIGALGTHLSVSPRGDKLLYVSGSVDSDLWRIDLPSRQKHQGKRAELGIGALRVLSSSRLDAMPDFSPDGRRVAFCTNRSGTMEVWVAEADGSRSRQLTFLGGPQALLPRWSPDGREIAFHANTARNRDVYVISAEGGKPRAVTNGPGNNFVASWSRDGKWIYYASDRGGAFECWKAPSAGGDAVQVTKQGSYGGIESVDGRYLYYAKTLASGAIWRVPVTGGEERPVHPAVRAFRVPWNFAVTGAGIYTVATEAPLSRFRLQLYSPRSGNLEILAEVGKSLGRSMAISPDDRWFMFQDYPARHGDLMLVENFR